MKVALLQINPTVGDLSGNARLIADAVARGGRARRGSGGHAGAGARRLPAARSAAQRRLRQAQLGSAARTGARARRPAAGAGRPAGAEPVRRRTAAVQHGGARPRRHRRSALPQGAAAHLRRLRRGPVLRAVPRRADPDARRPAARHQHLRGRLERSRLLEAPPLSPRSDRGARARGRGSHRQPVGVARSPPASTAGARRCSAAWRGSIACRSCTSTSSAATTTSSSTAEAARSAPRERRSPAAARSTPTSSSATWTARRRSRRRRTSSSNPRSGARSCSARATTRASAASHGRCSGSRAGSTPR